MGSPPSADGGACSSPPRMMMMIHPPTTPSPSKRMQLLPDNEIDRTSTSTCFHCKKQGHWVRDCPFKETHQPPPTPKLNSNSNSNFNVCNLPEIECDHGHGPCSAKVSGSFKNPSRIYYACLFHPPNGSKCGFFKWHDQLKMTNGTITTTGPTARPLTPSPSPSGPSLTPSQSEYPMCSCGAGLCRLMLDSSAPNAGRFYFVCPITKGHGACPFFLWYDGQANTKLTAHVGESRSDESLKLPLNGHQAIQTVNYDLDENDALCFEHSNRMTFESPEIDNLQPFPTFDFVPFGPSKIEEETLIGREERNDTSNMEASTIFSSLQVVVRAHLHDTVVQEGALLDPMMEKPPQVSQKTSLQTDILHQQIKFWMQSSAAGHTLTGGVFPSLDPVFIPKETYESHSESLIDLPQSPSHSGFHSSPQMPSEDDAQPLSGVLFELSGLKKILGPSEDSVVTGTIVEALEQAAFPIQNLLLTLLESMDPLKPESMKWAADCTFAALDHLSVDYRHFSERVTKFIACASSLAEIERSIHNDLSSQELIKWYHNERDRFDNISRTHNYIVGAFTTSDHHLESLRKEASRVKKTLRQIEKQLSLCEGETSELRTRVDEISEEKNESEKRLEAAAQKAEAAMELCRQREVTRNAAKAALEEARVKLR